MRKSTLGALVLTLALAEAPAALGLAVLGAVLFLVYFFRAGRDVQRFLARRSTKDGSNILATLLFVLAIAVLVNVLASRFRVQRDITQDRLFTLAPETESSLAAAPSAPEILAFYPQGDPNLPGVEALVPVIQGNAAVEGNGRTRRTLVLGASSQVPLVWRMQPELGRFLPDEGGGGGRALAVLGAKLKAELFGAASPLGARIRIGGEPYRVVGVMEAKGQIVLNVTWPGTSSAFSAGPALHRLSRCIPCAATKTCWSAWPWPPGWPSWSARR